MFHPSEAGRDLDMQREGSRGQAKRSFLSDVVSFLSRIFSILRHYLFLGVIPGHFFRRHIRSFFSTAPESPFSILNK